MTEITAREWTFDEAIQQIGFGPFQRKLMIICGAGWAGAAMKELGLLPQEDSLRGTVTLREKVDRRVILPIEQMVLLQLRHKVYRRLFLRTEPVPH